ncbi:MAG: response regulator transcription factor [Chloroflexi bacterium]|nr:response regulator transcription factor [Chloroflexota bacterium]
MTKISIFLCEWQVLFREGIHFTLCGEEDFEVIGEATNNAEALDFIEKNRPGVAILNASRGKPSAIEVAGRIKQNLSSVAIILIMDNHNDEQLFSAMKSGANACLSKDMSPDELVDTIRKVAQGDYPIGKALLVPAIASRVIDEFEVSSLITEETGNLPAHLSPVERAILSHIAGGSPIEEITRALDSNEEAIWRKLDLILTKLTANDHRREVIKTKQSNLAQ